MKKYEFLPHTADLKIKAYGKNPNEVFENCALAVSEYLARGKKIKLLAKKLIEVEGQDLESLMYNFLDEILFLIDAENFAVARTSVQIKVDKKNNYLKAVVYGDDASKYDLDQIKAATYAEMYVKKINDHWEAQVVLDV